jgi:hypothetical protein
MTGHVSNTELPRAIIVHGIKWVKQRPFLCATRVTKKVDLVVAARHQSHGLVIPRLFWPPTVSLIAA